MGLILEMDFQILDVYEGREIQVTSLQSSILSLR